LTRENFANLESRFFLLRLSKKKNFFLAGEGKGNPADDGKRPRGRGPEITKGSFLKGEHEKRSGRSVRRKTREWNLRVEKKGKVGWCWGTDRKRSSLYVRSEKRDQIQL